VTLKVTKFGIPVHLTIILVTSEDILITLTRYEENDNEGTEGHSSHGSASVLNKHRPLFVVRKSRSFLLRHPKKSQEC
jgi:hypothetical protein